MIQIWEMVLERRQLATAVAIAVAVLPVCGQAATNQGTSVITQGESTRDLVRDVIYNELHARAQEGQWEYRTESASAAERQVREAVETKEGTLSRLIEVNGSPLSANQKRDEDARLEAYVRDPGELTRSDRGRQEDEARLLTAMQLIPAAFVFEQGARENDLEQISFRPDPAYVPSSYEARVLHGMSGTMTVNTRLKRLVEMQGVLMERVDFGYGMLGHIEKGGSFEIHRRKLTDTQWKTDLLEVHVQGRLVMLKSVTKDERETRSDFRSVPRSTTLAEANEMLNQAADRGTEARLVPASDKQK